ncbi:MAG TPA: SDR family NAD(P)-dependent oxidoreductase [Gammaproteobacteria bacterium]|nr:SDR family NAD(P)-dependent oxidoreductase [Gammaproteobacteria bacterium]
MDIKGSVAFVTGANRGLGRAFVEGLIESGAARIYAAARVKETLDDVIRKHGERIIPVTLDITDSAAVYSAAEKAADVNLLVNNAGVACFEGFTTAGSLEAAHTEMNINYFGSLEMIRAFAPVLKDNGGGTIIQIASIASMVTFPVIGSYCASKAALNALIYGARAELAAQGTVVSGVYPGVVDTEMSARFDAPGVPPESIVSVTLEAVIKGEEDIYPDAMSQDLYRKAHQQPKILERELSGMLPVASAAVS